MATNKIQLPEGVKLSELYDNFTVCTTEYSKAFMKAKLLDAVDRGRMWEALHAKYPAYQLLPDTNQVAYVKSNILASVYTVGKSARLLPTSKEDKDIVEHLNTALEHIWSQLNVGWYEMQAGERAALLNLGVTQVGWDNSIVKGSGDAFRKGECTLKNIDPLRYMRDPFAENLDTAAYCMTWDYFHKSVILHNPLYKEAFQSYLASNGSNTTSMSDVMHHSDKISSSAAGKPNYYRVVTHWVRVESKVHEIHTLDNQYVLAIREDIKPSIFPFSELFCNLPAGDLLGTSEPAKVLSNSVVYNIMHSIIATSEYKNQRPPRFINAQANMNVPAFIKSGNDADKCFVVQGDASRAVHYHQFPQPTQAASMAISVLAQDIKQVSGVDGRYTGRDTGSILTTGGINSMLDQVTMVDAPKVECYNNYGKRLTELILSNYLEHSAISRSYLVKNPSGNGYHSVVVDFPSIPADTVFDYELNISSELPKNKSRVADMANKLMENQMQYQGAGISVDLITPEEWLMCQDLPMREYMQERMGIQRQANWTEMVAQAVNQYASLVERGVPTEDAIISTAQTMQAQNTPNGMQDLEQQMQNVGSVQDLIPQ